MDKKKLVIPMAVFCMSSVMVGTMSGCAAWDKFRDMINGKIDEIVTPVPTTKKTVSLKAGETATVETLTGNVEIIAGVNNGVTVTTDTDTMGATVVLPVGGTVTIGGNDFTNDRTSDMEITIDKGGTITVLPDSDESNGTGGESGDNTGDGNGSGDVPPVVVTSKVANLMGGNFVGTTEYSTTLHTYQAASGYEIRSVELDKSLLSGDGVVIAAIYASGNSVCLDIPDTNIHDLDGTLKVTITLSDGTTEEDEIELSVHVMCLTGDSLIRMADGTEKRIDSLSVGEKVLSFNPVTMRLEADEITYSDSKERKTHTEYDLWVFSDGTQVKTVHRHRLYNVERQAMVNMDEWYIGEHAYTEKGGVVSLVLHKNVKETVKHYTVFTKNQNYFVNGLLSGNKYTKAMSL